MRGWWLSVILTGALAAQGPSRSERIVLRGPTVIAFFAVTQAEVDDDSSSNIATVLDDFTWYLPKVEPVLRTHSVSLVESYRDTIHIVAPRGPLLRIVPRDSVRVGYIFWRAGREPLITLGVRTDMDLICLARKYFEWAKDSVTSTCP